jgi:hypothetical protein
MPGNTHVQRKLLKLITLCRYNKCTKFCEIPQFVFRSNDKSDVTDNCHWWQSYLEGEVSELWSLLCTWAPDLDSTGRRVGVNAHAQIEPPTTVWWRRQRREGGITSLDLNEHWTHLQPSLYSLRVCCVWDNYCPSISICGVPGVSPTWIFCSTHCYFCNMPPTGTVRPALINPPPPFLVQGTEVLYTVYI